MQPLNDLQNKPRLILFTRYPEPGGTKTRLIPSLGPCGAAEIHRRLAEKAWRTLKAFAAFEKAEAWIYHEGGTEKRVERWLGPASGVSLQDSVTEIQDSPLFELWEVCVPCRHGHPDAGVFRR